MNDQTIHVMFSGTEFFSQLRDRLRLVTSVRFTLQLAGRRDELFQHLTEERISVFLIDISSSEEQGLRDVVAFHAQAQEVPIVVLVGRDQEVLAQEALQAGAQDYLVKEDASPSLLARVIRYATERQRLMNELIRMRVYDDPLTGLPNRLLFLDRLRQAQAHAQRHGQMAAVLFLDLDNFKGVNDTLGHAAGDRLLKTVAQRLCQCVRKVDTVGRLGGDEFTLVLREIHTDSGAATVARKILRALADPCHVSAQPITITASIGISLYPHDACDAETLIEKADMAMYRAKADGKNRYRFSDGSTTRPSAHSRADSRRRYPLLARNNGKHAPA